MKSSVLAAMMLLTACTSIDPELEPSAFYPPKAPSVKLIPGDVIAVNFIYNTELNTEQMIRPDGYVSLPLLGEVKAEGKTPGTLDKEINESYKDQLKQPGANVVVRSLYHRKIFIHGEVGKPGTIEMPGPMTVMEAVAMAGGFRLDRARIHQVLVIRNINGVYTACALDMERLVKGQSIEQFHLEPKDIVYIPRKKVVEVNEWISQYINQMLPNLGLSYGSDGDFNVSR